MRKSIKVKATVKIKPEISISFQQEDVDFVLVADLDVLNFQSNKENHLAH
jgi:hypothetical protein